MRRGMVRFLAAAAAGLASLAFVGCGSSDEGKVVATATVIEVGGTPSGGILGVRIRPPLVKPEIVLTDQDGRPFDLRAETDGYLTLLYVGYTHCPDICPTHMADIAAALREVPPEVRQRVKVVFVTSDPERDTPEVLKRWLGLFDRSFIGLTGDQERIDRVQRALGMNPATKEDLGSGNYAVNHAAYVIAFTPQDDTAYTVYPFGITRDVWVNDITKLVTEGYRE